MKELLLIRGLPGSGKSTLAKVLGQATQAAVFSVDDYFTDNEGNYHFEFENNHLAYKQCETNARSAMESQIPLIILHNAFMFEWEWSPYFEMARQFGYRMHVVTAENFHGSTNIHGITQEQIERMAARYQIKLYHNHG